MGRSVIFILLFIILFFSFIFYYGNKEASRYVEANYEMEIVNTLVTESRGYGYLRGAIFYKKDTFIDGTSKLIGSSYESKIWKTNGPIIDFDTIPYKYVLSDLLIPYSIYKLKDNDTLHVSKSGFNLKFLMSSSR